MDEWIVTLLSPQAFARFIRGNWTREKVSAWHTDCKASCNRGKPLLPAEYERVLAWEDEHRRQCLYSGNGVNG